MTRSASRGGSIEAIKGLYHYAWSISGRDQIVLSALSVLTFLLELAPLELQRRIINDAVGGAAFRFIVVLCLLYVSAVLLQGGLKLFSNIYQGSVSEFVSRRLRLEPNLRAIAGSEQVFSPKDEGVAISVIVSEVDAVGGFVGTSFSAPVLNGGILLSVFSYMLFMQPWMALVALVVLIPQFFFIPALQAAINRSTEKRIQTLRAVAGEAIERGAYQADQRENIYRRRVGAVYRLNMQIYRRKFGMNFLMNFVHQLGVIGILSVGSWLLLHGRIELGTIVAFISGLNRTNEPWNDLVDFFRELTNAGVESRLIKQVTDTHPTVLK